MAGLNEMGNAILMKLMVSILVVFLFGCNVSEPLPPDNFIEKTVTLTKDFSDTPIGRVKLFVPIEFDTLLSWFDYSDCGGVKKYRLTNSRSCLKQESGFFKSIDSVCTDSIFRLTIEAGEQLKERPLDSNELNSLVDYTTNIHKDAGYPLPVWNRKEIQRINKLDYIVLDYPLTSVTTNYPYQQIVAHTCLKNLWITIRIECCQKDCSGFSEKAYQMLKSIKIDTI